MKRTFLALKINPDPSFSGFIYDLQRKIEGKLHWIDPDNLHLTIRFLGNTDDSQSGIIIEKMYNLFLKYESFDLEIQGLGFFGSIRFPRILWAGVKMPEHFFRIIEHIEDIVCSAGFEAETKPFSPHLTLSRIKYLKDPASLMNIIEASKEKYFWKQKITRIIFYESILRSEGSVYMPLQVFPLQTS